MRTSDLIDRHALKNKLKRWDECDPYEFVEIALHAVDDAPTIDTVPVVRCGECKYWSEVDTSDGLRYGQCDRPGSAIRGNCFIRESWFCADGEREVPKE